MGRLIDSQTAYDVLTAYYHHTTDVQHAALRDALSRVPTVDAVPIAWVEELIKTWRDENNAFSVIAATVLRAMIRKWEDGRHEIDKR